MKEIKKISHNNVLFEHFQLLDPSRHSLLVSLLSAGRGGQYRLDIKATKAQAF